MKFFSSTVSFATLQGRTYSSFTSAPAPNPAFSVAPLLAAALENEDVVDIETSFALDNDASTKPELSDDASTRPVQDTDASFGHVHVVGTNATAFHFSNAHSAPSPFINRSVSPALLESLAEFDRAFTDATDMKDDETKHNTAERGAGYASANKLDAEPPIGASAPPNSGPVGSSTSLPPTKLTSAGKRTKRDKERQKKKRKLEKANMFAASGQPPRPSVVKKHVSESSGKPLPREVDVDSLPTTSTAYEAKPKGSSGPKATRTLTEVLAEGIDLVKWNGIDPLFLTDPVTDAILVAGAGRIDSPDFTKSHNNACQAILNAGANRKFNKDHKRGKGFGALNVGVMAGQGPLKPYNLQNPGHEDMLKCLLENEDIRRLALFQSASFNMFLPNLYKKYHGLRRDVEAHMPELRWNFDQSVFSAAAFNFGPQTVTARHRDCMNLPYGFCAVTALGDFDYELGGHLVIEELGVAIEFPPGSCILLPSAVFTHSNTAIQPGEIRVSFTQFTSGALFRHADNGYRTEQQLKDYDEDLWKDMMARKAFRWEKGLALWSTIEEILAFGEVKVESQAEFDNTGQDLNDHAMEDADDERL